MTKHCRFMSGRAKEIRAELEKFEKTDLALRQAIAKRHERLNARWNAHHLPLQFSQSQDGNKPETRY
jgi:hypothetical protein